jgi:ABC-type antimicrobial peptide transport system permease subunit
VARACKPLVAALDESVYARSRFNLVLFSFDPVSFATVSLLLLVVGVQACFWLARRVARIDAVTALRDE